MAGYFLQGILSYTGVGGTVDLKSAYNYFTRSGDAMSKCFAAYMQFVGKGTPKDKKKGAVLFTRYKKVLIQTEDPFVDWLIGMMLHLRSPFPVRAFPRPAECRLAVNISRCEKKATAKKFAFCDYRCHPEKIAAADGTGDLHFPAQGAIFSANRLSGKEVKTS